MVENKSSGLRGIVVAKKANFFVVESLPNGLISSSLKGKIKTDSFRLLCTLRKRLLHQNVSVLVGDFVSIESIDFHANKAVISHLFPRKSSLERPSVANLTNVIVLLSLQDPTYEMDQASRFLIAAEQSFQQVDLVLTKSDLVKRVEVNKTLGRFQQWGYSPIAISTKTGEGISLLETSLKQASVSVLCGPSGVGKSSLLKYFFPHELISISDLSGKLKRGRNTTRNVELYHLGNGSFVADTPGFNRPDLLIEPKHLQSFFPEIRRQKNSCKFRDCLHLSEPGCGLDLDWERYTQYKKLVREMISYRGPYQVDLGSNLQ